MREQVDRLSKLTVDLLDLSKLDADAIQMRRERVQLTDVARRVATEFGPTADRHESPISIGDGPGAGRDRRPGQGRADHAYPHRQRAHSHAGGNGDQGRDPNIFRREHRERLREPRGQRRRPGNRLPRARARLRALLHGRRGERLRARARDRPRARRPHGRLPRAAQPRAGGPSSSSDFRPRRRWPVERRRAGARAARRDARDRGPGRRRLRRRQLGLRGRRDDHDHDDHDQRRRFPAGRRPGRGRGLRRARDLRERVAGRGDGALGLRRQRPRPRSSAAGAAAPGRDRGS